ncbi:MAG: 30S ribosomal protein S12 methylthiotransferase RimO [Planctomycetota bacterium]|nr:30S ribosomal protein S12 methylthiotransferase RimO [Planctomycetota bacterium]
MARNESLRVALVSLGCPKNLVDSEKMLAQLASGGCIVGAPMAEADVIVVNTCGFLAAARKESLEVIAEALRHKHTGRAQRVVVAGCLVNRDAERLYDLAKGIDAIVGVNNRDELPAAVRHKGRITKIDSVTLPSGRGSKTCNLNDDAGRFRLTPRHTAYLRIAEGCSHKCSFCTIPAIRGPFRSKLPRTVLAEARELIADGARELNVIAQDTTTYGTDLCTGEKTTAHLLRELDKLDGLRWIRLMYTYPRRFSKSLIDTIAECERIVPYVDLPLQHISDPILRRMGRGVTRGGIESLLKQIRKRIPGVAIRTTFIVGFPGETDKQFTELLEFAKAFHFDALGVFAFSPEQGTPAAKMHRQVPENVKADRVEAVMLAQRQIAFAAGKRKSGQDIDILIDGIDPAGRCVGRHAGQAPDIDGICYLTKPQKVGTFVQGKVVGSEGYDLIVKIDD